MNPAGAETESNQRWTTRSLMKWMSETFGERGVDEPRLTAELLLERAAGLTRLDLYTQADRPASAEELATLRAMVKRVLGGEPVQYALGAWYFFGLRLGVDKRVLIPRPCTELICEEVIQDVKRREREAAETGGGDEHEAGGEHAEEGGGDDASRTAERTADGEESDGDGDPAAAASAQRAAVGAKRRAAESAGTGVLIADIGTGSGAIAIALAKHLPGATVIATDISAEALDVARTNAAEHGVDERIEFVLGDGPEALFEHAPISAHGGLDYLVSNPPYIPDAEWDDPSMMDAHVREHEPELALRGGADGLDVIRRLVRAAPRLMKVGGMLAIETAASTATAVAAGIDRTPGVATRAVRTDLDGHPRVVVAERVAP